MYDLEDHRDRELEAEVQHDDHLTASYQTILTAYETPDGVDDEVYDDSVEWEHSERDN